MSDTPGTKAELLERIRSSYAALNALVLQLSTAQLTQPIDTTWSVKDMLAHITAWEQIMLHFHIGKRPFEQVTQLGNIGYTALNVDELNEALFQRDQAHTLDKVLAAFRASHQATLARLEQIDEAELYREYMPPGRGPDSAGVLIDWVTGDTYEHYDEHRATIERAFPL